MSCICRPISTMPSCPVEEPFGIRRGQDCESVSSRYVPVIPAISRAASRRLCAESIAIGNDTGNNAGIRPANR